MATLCLRRTCKNGLLRLDPMSLFSSPEGLPIAPAEARLGARIFSLTFSNVVNLKLQGMSLQVVTGIPSPIHLGTPMVLIKPKEECATAEVYKVSYFIPCHNHHPCAALSCTLTPTNSAEI